MTTRAAADRPAVWRDSRFRLFWTGQAVSDLGDRVSELALPLVAITVLHARPFQVGVLTAAIWLPNLLALFVGTWVDHLTQKKPMLIVANLVQAGAVVTVPIAYVTGTLGMPILYVVAVVGGLGGVLYHTAYPPFFAQLVPRKRYVEANSLLSATRSGSAILGPPVGGALIKVFGAPVALVVDACSFLISAALINRVELTERNVDTATEGYRVRLRQGVGYLRRHSYLRATLACSTTLNFFSFVVTAVLLLYASRTLGLGAGTIGLALGVGATGALVGAAAAGPISRRIGTGWTIAAGAVLFSLPFATLTLVDGTPIMLRVVALATVEFISGFGIMLFDINLNSLQTAVTLDSMRSRVSGAYATVNYGIRPLGAVLGGWSAEQVGIPATMFVAGLAGALAILWLIPSPVLTTRRVDDLQQVP